ncbi:Serine/threonine protein kinase OS=Streptomyces alboniger OX=132473 GN=CP975_17630 PE=4 SV=1 [Streptomyces alboniger]
MSALLIAALGLGSWQLADALMDRENSSDSDGPTQTTNGGDKHQPRPSKPIAIEGAQEYVLKGSPQAPESVRNTYDKDSSSLWRTKTFNDGPEIAPYKPGVGIVYDLGSAQDVSAASIALKYGGSHTTVSLYATDSLTPSAPIDSMKKIGGVTTSGTTAKISAKKPVKSR